MITLWPSIFKPDEGRRVGFDTLLERVKAPRSYAGKDEVWRWSAATFGNNYRSRASFLTEQAIVTDIGDYPGGVQREQLVRAVEGILGFAYTTWSSTQKEPRWRVVRMLSRPIDADEHDRLWRYVAELEERAGIVPDVAKDAPHAWALPARHDGDSYECVDFDGEPLDVDMGLERFPKPDPLPPPSPRHDDVAHRIERASKYLATMPGAISGSGGHTATFRVACVLVRGFALDADDALRLLVEEYNPRCAPAWSLHELRHKVRQALQRSRLPFGWLADRVRDGSAA